MMRKYTLTYPKLLLFGEYGMLLGGTALTVPLKSYSAQLDFMDNTLDLEFAQKSNSQLKEFVGFLNRGRFFRNHLDVEGLVQDVEDGLYFLSNIPSGYGLGSSGALCAALYKTYGKAWKHEEEPAPHFPLYKKVLSAMEAHFHGKSSGLDPLVCLVGEPLLFKRGKISLVNSLSALKGNWFLIDTGIVRNTAPLVGVFLNKFNDGLFKYDFQSHYLAFTNKIFQLIDPPKPNTHETGIPSISAFMEGVSVLQLKYFREMIPSLLEPFWQFGLDSGNYFVKLLGAGGGGYFLVLSLNSGVTKEMAKAYGLKIQWIEF